MTGKYETMLQVAQVWEQGKRESQVTMQVQIDSLLISSPRWKDTLTLPLLTVYSQTNEFVYRINRYFLKGKACKDHFYPQIKRGSGQQMQLNCYQQITRLHAIPQFLPQTAIA
ncbi:hypothetical protein E2C01_001505 [Portunus trituberculatus]|uniref:Uncharacterized protein n=1 Tax=Portunus trituberculatus TaxID=210409 RepID=A0A5B7CHC4_PORTR|nr:hypothetical protein [Portunus trituberculatus]